VAPAAHGHQQVIASSEIDRIDHISDPGAAGDNGGPMVDHRVVDLARRIVSLVTPKKIATAPSGSELLDYVCMEHDLATCRRRDFDIRHVDPSFTFGTSASNGYINFSPRDQISL
jgi:hypothetical protein